MQQVNVGNIWLPDELVNEVNAHKERVIDSNRNSPVLDTLLRVDFGTWLGDYLYKFSYRMTDYVKEIYSHNE